MGYKYNLYGGEQREHTYQYVCIPGEKGNPVPKILHQSFTESGYSCEWLDITMDAVQKTRRLIGSRTETYQQLDPFFRHKFKGSSLYNKFYETNLKDYDGYKFQTMESDREDYKLYNLLTMPVKVIEYIDRMYQSIERRDKENFFYFLSMFRHKENISASASNRRQLGLSKNQIRAILHYGVAEMASLPAHAFSGDIDFLFKATETQIFNNIILSIFKIRTIAPRYSFEDIFRIAIEKTLNARKEGQKGTTVWHSIKTMKLLSEAYQCLVDRERYNSKFRLSNSVCNIGDIPSSKFPQTIRQTTVPHIDGYQIIQPITATELLYALSITNAFTYRRVETAIWGGSVLFLAEKGKDRFMVEMKDGELMAVQKDCKPIFNLPVIDVVERR